MGIVITAPSRAVLVSSIFSFFLGFTLAATLLYIHNSVSTVNQNCDDALANLPPLSLRVPAPVNPMKEVFPESMNTLFHRMGRVSRDDFAAKFDIGYGIDASFENNNEVLLLYGSKHSLPTNYSRWFYCCSSSANFRCYGEL
jgi:hypothetical protein